MKRYILIGGIGSGKTSLSKRFEELGALCIDLDQIGHELLGDPVIQQQLCKAFGQDVMSSQGYIERQRLAQLAFTSKEGTEMLNAVMHPAIEQAACDLLDQAQKNYPIALIEVSAYSRSANSFQRLMQDAAGIIAVVAPEQVRIERAVQKGFEREDVLARIARQPTDEERANWADYIVINDGTKQDFGEQVDKLWEEITGE